MNNNEIIKNACLVLSFGLTAVQIQQMFQVIQLVLAIIASLVSIVLAIINWWSKSKKDGKITIDEVEDLADDLKENIEDMQNNIEQIEKGNKDNENKWRN